MSKRPKNAQNCLRMFKNQKLIFDSISLTNESPDDKENSILWKKKKSLWTQLNFIEGLIEFIEVLIARKIDFGVNLGFNWKKLIF